MSNQKIQECEYPKIKEYYLSGMSAAQIGKLYCVANNTILTILKKLNVKIRSVSQSTSKYDLNENYFNAIDSTNKAYILGLIYSDGCIYINETIKSYKLSITLQEEDLDVLEKVKKELEYSGPIYFKKTSPNRKDAYTLCINNKMIVESLLRLGVTPRKSYTVEFPIWLEHKYIPHFIRGYIDGDGHIDKSQINFVSTKMMCEPFKSYMEETYKLTSSIRKRITKNTTDLFETWSIYSYDKKCWFANWIYKDADIYMDRKHDSCIKYRYLNVNNL